MASVYKKSRIKAGKRVHAAKWTCQYRDPASGRHREAPGFRDKEASLAKARRLEREASRRAEGLPVADAAGRRMPFAKAHELYLAELRRLGRSQTHRDDCRKMIARAARLLKWATLGDVRGDTFHRWLAALERSPRTQNAYLGLCRTFLEWCVSPPRCWLAENPLAGIPKAADPKDDRPHRRRALDRSELNELIAQSPPRREVVYRLAAWTGFRRSTLRKLRAHHLDLSDPSRPRWRLPAGMLKNRRSVTIPATPEAVAVMRTVALNGTHPEPGKPLFRVPIMRTFHQDAQKAGIVHTDHLGRRVVFHSLRYFFAREMSKRLPIQKVKALLCHRTLAMTADLYADLGLDAETEDAWTVPGQATATGTATT